MTRVGPDAKQRAAAYMRAYRAGSPDRMRRNRDLNAARSRALTALAVEYPYRFAELLDKECAAAGIPPSGLPAGRPRSQPRECAKDDCERPAYARGMCSMHYQRWQKASTVGAVRNTA